MAGYTRQSTYTDGDVITAAHTNDEFDQILAAFNNTTGHAHDGTAAEGPVIGLIGDPGIATPKNKVVVDDTNNQVEISIDVSGTSTEQFVIKDGVIEPTTTNDIDLGASAKQFKDLYLDGTATIDGLAMPTTTVTDILDEDTMSSDSATALATQQSIKAYVDSQVTAQDLDFQGDSGGALNIDLDSETLTIAGGTGIDTTGAGNTLTIDIDSTVATLTGTQTLTNKTLTTPVISTISNTGTITLPTSTDTLVGRATTDTLTNKTLTSPTVTTATLNGAVSGTSIKDEDNMVSDSASHLATQQSIKAYVDAQVATKDALSELSGDSDDITEGTTNLFFTNERVDDRVDSLLTAGSNITLTYDDTANTLTIAATDTDTGILNVVEDTTPQLGGDLDVNGNKITSASNGDIDIEPNGTGNVLLGNFEFDVDQTVGSGQDDYILRYDHSTGHISLEAESSGGLSDVVSDTTPQLGGNLDTNSNNIEFGDNDKAIFGAGTDLQVYHAGGAINHIVGLVGSSTYITGGTDLYLRGVNGEEGVTINGNGAVELFHDNVKKLETVTGGVTVTGTATATAFVGDGSGLTNLPSAGITQAQADAGATALAIALG
jgi:hypothetical protein